MSKTKPDTTKYNVEKQDTQQKTVLESNEPLQFVGAEKIDYNIDQINEFIGEIFHTVPAGARRLVYAGKSTPGFPLENGVDGLNKILTRSKNGRALYFCASTCHPAPDDGKLYHRKTLFEAFHVLVLDDIGTKIAPEDMPEGLDPTYVIESSAGNYQWGFVLDQPIAEYRHAAALVQAFALAGYTDKGGAMPCKLVRLPDGINGKKDPAKRNFHVRLEHMDGPLWTPELLIKRLNLEIDNQEVTWDAIVNDELSPFDKKFRTPYMPLRPVAQNADGSVDPVLEWLYANNKVLADSGNHWVDVECPWCDSHTTGNNAAGYKPIGRGDDPEIRAFHCFHDHCSENRTPQFIEHVLANSDFTSIPVRDPSAEIFQRYLFDETSNCVWRMGAGMPKAVNIDGFKNRYNRAVVAYKQGKEGLTQRTMSVAQLWLESPYRIVISGARHEPGFKPMIEDASGDLWINTYQPPLWGDGQFDQSYVDKFMDYVDYLIPDKVERDYFMDWLAAKVQDPRFRGTGIIMYTPSFGVGRSTLGVMLGHLVGEHNTMTIRFDELIGNGAYNYWEDKQLVIVSEAKESASYAESKGPHKAYETLKQRVDTSPTKGVINLKYQAQRDVSICSSHLILTNHPNAVAVPDDDRRLTVLSNPEKPESPAFFNAVHQWLDARDDAHNPVWARHVYRWLRKRDVNLTPLMLPLRTESKDNMIEDGKNKAEAVCHAVQRTLVDQGVHFITNPQFRRVLDTALLDLEPGREYHGNYLVNCMDDVSISVKKAALKIDGKATRIRVFKRSIAKTDIPTGFTKMSVTEIEHETGLNVRGVIAGIDCAKLAEKVVEMLDA